MAHGSDDVRAELAAARVHLDFAVEGARRVDYRAGSREMDELAAAERRHARAQEAFARAQR